MIEKGHITAETSIRGQIIKGFLACFLFMGLITAINYWNTSHIRNRLNFLETAHEFLNTILEMRRYEKNYFLYKEMASYQENLNYTGKALVILQKHAETINGTIGKECCDNLTENLYRYQSLIKQIGSEPFQTSRQEKIENQIRRDGEKLVEEAVSILAKQRQKTANTLRHSQHIPVFFLVALLTLALYIIHQIANKIVAPLVYLEQMTQKIARGNFSPVSVNHHLGAEISHFAGALNSMAQELMQRQEELCQSRKMAAIGTLTSGIAHELNNPINNISLSTESYLEDYQRLSDEEKLDLVRDISSNAERTAEIVRNLLDFSRSGEPVLQPVSLNEIISATVKLVKNQFTLRGIKLELAIPDDLPKIKGESRSLEQVFLNLILNSVQAMPGGGKITIKAKEDSNFVKIDVADTGIGIPPENLHHIFEPFFTTKGVGRGTGLGMSVTYGIIKKHSGNIRVTSTPNIGTTFSIDLPKEHFTPCSKSG